MYKPGLDVEIRTGRGEGLTYLWRVCPAPSRACRRYRVFFQGWHNALKQLRNTFLVAAFFVFVAKIRPSFVFALLDCCLLRLHNNSAVDTRVPLTPGARVVLL